MLNIYLGNSQPVSVHHKDDAEKRGLDGTAWGEHVRVPSGTSGETHVRFDEDPPIGEVLTALDSVWQWHSDADSPDWVSCDDEFIAQVVARHFNIEVRK